MALTATTLAAALGASDISMTVASATGFAANTFWYVDGECVQVAKSYSSGVVIPILRGQNGTIAAAHPTSAKVVGGAATEFTNPQYGGPVVGQQTQRARTVTSYSASGAIALPTPGSDAVAFLNGTSVLAMTVAVPTKDMDGDLLWICSNGAAAHTVTFTGGLSGASTSYDVITVNASAPVLLGPFMAANGLWQGAVAVPMGGTVTNITASIA